MPHLTPEVNELAEKMVITNIARFPQTWDGPNVLIAHAALGEFDQSKSPTGIGIRELACLRPDPQRAANLANQIHDTYGIPRHVSGDKAERFVIKGARYGIEEVRKAAMDAAKETGSSIPTGLNDRLGYPGRLERAEPSTVWRHTQMLHTLLREDDPVRDLTLQAIGQRAKTIRSDSRQQQQRAQSRVNP